MLYFVPSRLIYEFKLEDDMFNLWLYFFLIVDSLDIIFSLGTLYTSSVLGILNVKLILNMSVSFLLWNRHFQYCVWILGNPRWVKKNSFLHALCTDLVLNQSDFFECQYYLTYDLWIFPIGLETILLTVIPQFFIFLFYVKIQLLDFSNVLSCDELCFGF